MKSRDIRILLTASAVLAQLSVANNFSDPKSYIAASLAGVTAWLSPSKLGAKKKAE
jgi:hypothetical protein